MLRRRSDEEYQARSEGGVRHLFTLGQYEFQDTMDAEEHMHHHLLERTPEGAETTAYEVDRETMYEFMARYLAGSYEIEEYELEHSPSHHTLLDVLEIATARARSGETEFSWEEFDHAENEIMEDEEEEEDQGERGWRE